MLPGFRFLFATTLLTASLVICGLGAASLLKAAYQETSKPPLLRALRDPFPPAAIDASTLALVRIDPAPSAAPELANGNMTEPAAPAAATTTVQAALTDDLPRPAVTIAVPNVPAPAEDASTALTPARAEPPAASETAAADAEAAKPKADTAETTKTSAAESKPAETNASAPVVEMKAADPVVTAALPEQSSETAPAAKIQPAKSAANNARAAQLAKARRQTAARAAAARRQATAKQQSPFGF